MDLSLELTIAQEIARIGGATALRKQSNLKVRYKPENQGPVSDADIFIDDFLCRELKKHFPADQIISEEGYQDGLVAKPGRVWLIDPIDGTASFILGRPDFVIMIGLLIDHEPVLGVIYQPSCDTMWSGISYADQQVCQKTNGQGQETLKLHRVKKDGTKLRLLVSPHTRSKRQSELIARITPSSIIKQSSIGLKAMLVANGQADFYVCWNRRMKIWDTCAPMAIAQAAGALMCHLDGSALSFKESTHAKSIMVANFEPDLGFCEILREIAEE